MVILIDDNGRVLLEDADTFTAFHVSAPGLSTGAIVSALGEGSEDAGDGNVWVAISRLHDLGASHGSPNWREGCDGMLAFAQTKGWIHDDGLRVRAHIEG